MPGPIENDILLVVGGSFTPDHLGPDAHDQVIQRIRAAPTEYLDTFARMFTRDDVDPMALADLYLPAFLELVAARAPARTSDVGRRLAAVYGRGIPAGAPEAWEELDDEGEPTDATRRRRRLMEHRAALQSLLGPGRVV